MFTSGEGSSLQDQSGAAGEIFVPTRFVWPHGGRRVLLTGTFTRWSGLVPMSPVEGCPTVFQVVYPVTLGAHQYKFNVDGQWRHDDNQPHATGDYGIVNTVVLAQEHVSGTGTMDVDNEQLHPLVAESGGSLQEAAGSSISEADLEQSRHSFSSFLSSHIAYELLPESGKVTALDVNLPVKQAFHILYEKGISMAPLWDFFRGQFVGVLSALDFILILRELGSNGSNLSEEELETHTISAWKEGKQQLYGHLDEQGRPVQRHLIHIIDEGQGWETPREPYEVTTRINAKAADGKMIMLCKSEPYYFTFGKSEVPKGLEMAIGTMTRGEKAIVFVKDIYLTQSPLLTTINGFEEVQFEVELVHFIQAYQAFIVNPYYLYLW